MLKITRSHPLILFFALTFLFSWAIWVPMALNYSGLLPFRLDPGLGLVVRLFGTFGPAAAASVVAVLLGGRPALRALWAQLKIWKVSWVWYALSGLVFPVLVLVIAWIYQFLPGVEPLPYQPVSPANLLVVMVILTLSVLGEEVGWRGFALPHLQRRWTPLQSSLLLGTIHTIWHLPFWIILGELDRFGWTYWILSWMWVLAMTIYITWIMNNTGNSLLMVFLFHWSLNVVTVGYLPITTVIPAYILLIGIAWVIALWSTGLFGTKMLRIKKYGHP